MLRKDMWILWYFFSSPISFNNPLINYITVYWTESGLATVSLKLKSWKQVTPPPPPALVITGCCWAMLDFVFLLHDGGCSHSNQSVEVQSAFTRRLMLIMNDSFIPCSCKVHAENHCIILTVRHRPDHGTWTAVCCKEIDLCEKHAVD